MQSMSLNNANMSTPATRSRKLISAALWFLQVALAVVFVLHGWLMVAPPAELVEMINAQLGVGLRLFIGVAELLAAAGLILPGLTRILPKLTALAAAGLMIVMSSATVVHLSRGEGSSAVTTAILLVLVTVVAYMRWKVMPIAARRRG
jgi:uncharacterized membrane protein YphA (DoxX/SURF4 family)